MPDNKQGDAPIIDVTTEYERWISCKKKFPNENQNSIMKLYEDLILSNDSLKYQDVMEAVDAIEIIYTLTK